MAMTLGTRGEGGHNLVRDLKTYKRNRSKINFDSRPKREPNRVQGGKQTFVYGKKGIDDKLDICCNMPST